jgi:Mg2+/Co2+ transporter CorC
LCSKSEDPDMAHALAGLAISSYKKNSGSRARAATIGKACCWALGHMPVREGIVQLNLLKDTINDSNAQKVIEKALAIPARQ